MAYLILGAPSSGRREVLADLIDGTLDGTEPTVVLLADTEAPAEIDQKLGTVIRWTWTEAQTIDGGLPEGVGRAFFITDGRRNPIDQIEAFKAWLTSERAELARIICVVNCRLAELHPQLLVWYDACIHFSDVVLLNRREGVANKWISDFQARYHGQYFPCHMEMVKAGRVHNPALILEPQPLRISHAFDPDLQWVVKGADGEEIDDDEEIDEEDEEEVEMVPSRTPISSAATVGPGKSISPRSKNIFRAD